MMMNPKVLEVSVIGLHPQIEAKKTEMMQKRRFLIKFCRTHLQLRTRVSLVIMVQGTK